MPRGAYAVRAAKEQRRKVVGDKLVEKLLADYKRRTGTRASPGLRARINNAMRELMQVSGSAGVKSSDVVQAFRAAVAATEEQPPAAARSSKSSVRTDKSAARNAARNANPALVDAVDSTQLPPAPRHSSALLSQPDAAAAHPPPPLHPGGAAERPPPLRMGSASRAPQAAVKKPSSARKCRGEVVAPFNFDHCPTFTPDIEFMDPGYGSFNGRSQATANGALDALNRSTPSRLMNLLAPVDPVCRKGGPPAIPIDGPLVGGEKAPLFINSAAGCAGHRRPATSHPVGPRGAPGSPTSTTTGASVLNAAVKRMLPAAQPPQPHGTNLQGDSPLVVRRNLQASPNTPFPPVAALQPRPPSGQLHAAGGLLGALAASAGAMWPVPEENPRCRDLIKQKEGEWAKRVKEDLDSYRDEVSQQRQQQQERKKEHSRELHEQLEAQKARQRQQQEEDLQFVEHQEHVNKQLDALESAHKQLQQDQKHKARQQMLHDMHCLDEHRRYDAAAKRKEDAAIRQTLQRDADLVQQDKLHQLRRTRKAAEEAQRFNEWSKAERARQDAQLATPSHDRPANGNALQDLHTSGTAVSRAVNATSVPTSRPSTRNGRGGAAPCTQQQRVLNAQVTALFKAEQAAQERRRQEQEARTQQEAAIQRERLEQEVEDERRRKEYMSQQMRNNYREKQAQRELQASLEREEKKRAYHMMKLEQARYEQETLEARCHDAERKIQYIQALRDQVEASPRHAENEPEVCITKRYDFKY
eukprot:TRINITY_DN28019_c0_g1_i1.p2 TRINITY_DN28019_c0_g1~~TRINITY_DN28019_c0_g1_i1.p2  ORF type:complete len:756 (+),score=291.28 TRINITY_DN28019_c0_g1_i1:68-2335(+)